MDTDSFNKLYTDSSIYFTCAIGKYLYNKIAMKSGIKNIVSIGHSLYNVTYFMERYYKSPENKLNIMYIPFSGKFPSTYDIENDAQDDDQYENDDQYEIGFLEILNNFYSKNKKLIDSYIVNTSIMDLINKSFNEKIAIIDYIHTGGGITSFIIMCLLVIIVKMCSSKTTGKTELTKKIELTKMCMDTINTSFKNIYLYGISFVDPEYYTNQFNFGFLEEWGLRFNFNDHVYITNFGHVSINKYNSKTYGRYRTNFNEQAGEDIARCIPSYKSDMWTKKYQDVLYNYDNSQSAQFCNIVKSKIDDAIINHPHDIDRLYLVEFCGLKFETLTTQITNEQKKFEDENENNDQDEYENNDQDEYENNDQEGGKYYYKYMKYFTKLSNYW